MFKLDFNIFMEMIEKLKLDTNKPTPTIHYIENEDMFILYIKGIDFWKDYTMVSKKDIIEFGETTGLTPTDALVEWRLNYLVHAVRITEEVFYNLPEHIFKPKVLTRTEGRPGKDGQPFIIKDLDPGEDIINESKSYDEFIVKNFDRWEEKALAAIDKVDVQKLYESKAVAITFIEKTFGEFLQQLFNGIQSLAFQLGSRKFITESMKEGLKDAESEVKVDIGISETFNNRVKSLADQELNGYTIQGKKWHGIKGVTAELRQDILNSVRDGVINRESRTELKDRVKDIFKVAKDSQAERIARTETNRFLNEGKLQGFKDSGVQGRKTYLIVNDDVTSPVCKRLGARYSEKGVGFDEPFRDEKTGKEYQGPPAHTNCRSVIGFEFVKEE